MITITITITDKETTKHPYHLHSPIPAPYVATVLPRAVCLKTPYHPCLHLNETTGTLTTIPHPLEQHPPPPTTTATPLMTKATEARRETKITSPCGRRQLICSGLSHAPHCLV